MLDFYLIHDEQITQESPSDLEFIDNLDDKTFQNLKTKKIIPDNYDYFSDFRWNTTVIKQILNIASNQETQNDTDIQQLKQILSIADNRKSGLIAFAD
ncbi:hypothetical protein [Flavobacterium sp. FlaQc-47]|uniref:hypothetical protein n=1 Tax=Flavobacterium sp. FlaQc-47 TaxID=3374180 RepID=UPI0037582C74